MNKDKQVVWRESIRKYGKEIQSIVCMEECSELIQAVSKCLRGKPDATDNLAEEMADVTICLHMLQEMYGVPVEELNDYIDEMASGMNLASKQSLFARDIMTGAKAATAACIRGLEKIIRKHEARS